MVFTTEQFVEAAIESSEFRSDALTDRANRP